MGIAEYDTLDGLGLADLVRRREVTAAELLEEAIARAERVNPKRERDRAPIYEEARREVAAGAARDGAGDRPFEGVPFLLKDLDAAIAGVPLAAGSRFLADYRPARDAEIVRRFRRAGLVIFGKTNTARARHHAATPSRSLRPHAQSRGTSP